MPPRSRSGGEGLQLRAATLTFDLSPRQVGDEARLLLVRQRRPDGTVLWRPPGGALAPDHRSLAEVAALETWLETGLRIDAGRLALIEESRPPWRLTSYFVSSLVGGVLISGLDYANGPLELALIEGASFLTQAELRTGDCQPSYLYDDAWLDLAHAFQDAPRFRPLSDKGE